MPRFTIRVYGLLLHNDRVLVADEIIKGQRITKFPGGGLEYGEGTKDCLIREVREEIGVEAFDVRHFYTTDFFQRSTFHAEEIQVLSLYYTFRVHVPDALPVIDRPFAFAEEKEGAEAFRWLDLATSTTEAVHLPIDKVVLEMLLGQR
ncbi:MAG: NUDIX domain-containing protein [Flavobacteriales bacterium]|nr:MAG: NUDIX domain-containing protein [Flavobacteriales bacterium]